MANARADEADGTDKEPAQVAAGRVIYAAIAANLGIAAAKFIAAAFTGSAAMLAEGIHSAVDIGNELLLLVGIRHSSRPPDQWHPFGYGKALYFWALLVALSVFSLGGGLSIYHGITSLRHPAPLQQPGWNYAVLAVAALFEGYSWNLARRALNSGRRRGISLWQAVRESKDASVFTVFVEDSAALIGIAVAALGIGLGQWFDNPYFDPAASIVIGLVLVAAAITLARETGALLVGESISRDQVTRLRAIFASEPAVASVGHLLTMQLGPDQVLLAAAVQFRRGLRIDEVERAIERLERAVRAEYPSIQQIYFEADAIRAAFQPSE
jgi:cation diffusion facilitator family transporter